MNPATENLFGSFESIPGSDQSGNDEFCLDSLLIHAWLGQLLAEARTFYSAQMNPKRLPMQTGQAQRGFLQAFGHTSDLELHRLLQSLHRFSECDDPLAAILYRGLVSLSAEHESAGDFDGPRALDAAERPRGAAMWLRESLERWCDWIDAVIHMQTHVRWHLAPETFAPGTASGELPTLPRAPFGRFRPSEPKLAARRFTLAKAGHSLADLPAWQLLPQMAISQPQRPWPHPELDETIISLWPLVKRHNWTFSDLLTVLQDLLLNSDAYPCQSERNLATYAINTLHLRKSGQGKTARLDRPVGYTVALRLFPPPPPRANFVFGEPFASGDAPSFPDDFDSSEEQLDLW